MCLEPRALLLLSVLVPEVSATPTTTYGGKDDTAKQTSEEVCPRKGCFSSVQESCAGGTLEFWDFWEKVQAGDSKRTAFGSVCRGQEEPTRLLQWRDKGENCRGMGPDGSSL